MKDLTTRTLDLPPLHLRALCDLLAEHVQQAEVWAYGSRVSGGSHSGSDLDLVLRHPANLPIEQRHLHRLVGALGESHLPIVVEVHDWARLPDSFRREIEKAHVVVQKGSMSGGGSKSGGPSSRPTSRTV